MQGTRGMRGRGFRYFFEKITFRMLVKATNVADGDSISFKGIEQTSSSTSDFFLRLKVKNEARKILKSAKKRYIMEIH